MAHELAGALQQAGRIRQRCAVKEPHVYVRSEYIDVAEGRISQTCHRTAVMQKFPDFVPAFSHHLKPLIRDGSQFTCMLFHPRIDGGIPLDSAVESQQFRSHRRSTSRSATTNSQSFHRFVLDLGTDPRVHGPPLSENFVYLSLAAEIEPEGRRFAGTLELEGVFSHGILRATRWFQGATLSSYSMGSPKPSVWTPSWRRASKANHSAMRVECHDMGEDAAVREGLRRFAQSVDERIIPAGAVSDVTENPTQFSISLFEPLQQGLRGALRFGRAVHIHIGSGQRGGPDFLGEDNVF